MKVYGLCCAIVAVLVAALFAGPAWAKNPPDTLVVEGPGLTSPVAITDAAALAGFSPWDRGFIAWDRGPATAPPPTARRYAVYFYLAGREVYVLDYVPAPAGEPGSIYLPGPGDPAYGLNSGTIVSASTDRWDPNGRWQYATAAWDAALSRALRGPVPALPWPATSGHLGTVQTALASVPTLVPTAPGAPLRALTAAVLGLLGISVGVVWRRRHESG